MLNFNIFIMFNFRIITFLFLNLIFIENSITGQEISANLQLTYQDKDSLLAILSLKNETAKKLYLVCKIDEIGFDDWLPIQAQYANCCDSDDTNKKNHSFIKKGDVRDHIRLTLPDIKKRYQLNHTGEKIDIFEVVEHLMRLGGYYKLSNTDSDSSRYFDVNLYRLIKKEHVLIDPENDFFIKHTVILAPNEKKIFYFNLDYLLLRRATYQLLIDYKTNNKLFKEETKFLDQLGYHRFKGRITSNVIQVVSE
ncbi:MAG: hypothetical protein PHV20_01360 [Bacteroidales bacterium]|nr:hypothetical protein [Bacteroidales bacterium]